MSKYPTPGLRTRIVLSLAVVLALFIVLTEMTVSQLVKVSLSRNEVTSSVGSASLEHSEYPSLSPKGEKELNRLRKIILFYMITGAIIALILGSIAVTRAAVSPLSKITKAVERVADGDLETKVPISGSGELILLGVSFNRMTHTLKEQRTTLEEQLESLRGFSTDLKNAQDRLIRAAKLASVGTLAAGIAHEIGNPIAGILGLLDALDNETNNETAASYRGLIRKEIKRVDKIIGELLTYARPVKHDQNIPASAELNTTIDHVKNLLKAQRLFDRINIKTSIIEAPSTVAMSQNDLTGLLVNLFLNAAEAMDGDGMITVDIKKITYWRPALAVTSRSAVQIIVTDNGPGVDNSIANMIFDPFFTKREKGTGSGLGLAICQSICDRSGAEIILDKQYKEGARFVVTLPTASQ